MSDDAGFYDIPGLTADDIAHVLETSRRAAHLMKNPPPPGKLSSRTIPHGPPAHNDALDQYRFDDNDTPADLLARRDAYRKAQNAGLIRHFRK